jgi:hypothetical protein
MRTNPFRWLVLLLSLALLLAACGGDEPSDGASQPTDGATEPTDGGAPDGDAIDQLLALGQQWATTTGRITYSITSTGGAAPDTPSEITLYWRPPSSWRMDMTADAGSTVLIATPEGAYLCGEGMGALGGGTDAGSACLQLPADQVAGSNPFASLIGDPEALRTTLRASIGEAEVTTSTRTIAGIDATCFTATGTPQGDAEWCFSDNGLLLYAAGAAAGDGSAGTMEATEVSDEVSDADFEPPYEVVSIPTGLPTDLPTELPT